MTTSTRPMTVARIVRDLPQLSHAENPARPGYGLCDTKLSGKAASASRSPCMVCISLIRPDWSSR